MPLDLLPRLLFKQIPHLVLAPHLVVDEDVSIQSSVIDDDASDVAADVPQVCQCGGDVAGPGDFGLSREDEGVGETGREFGDGDLVPPADVDDGVGEGEGGEVRVDDLFEVAEEVVAWRERRGGVLVRIVLWDGHWGGIVNGTYHQRE